MNIGRHEVTQADCGHRDEAEVERVEELDVVMFRVLRLEIDQKDHVGAEKQVDDHLKSFFNRENTVIENTRQILRNLEKM